MIWGAWHPSPQVTLWHTRTDLGAWRPDLQMISPIGHTHTIGCHWYTGTPDCLPGQRLTHVRCCQRGIAIPGHRHPTRARKVSPVPGHIWISLHPQIWVLIHHGAWIAPWRCHVTRVPAIGHLPWGWRRARKWCHWRVLMPRIHRPPARVRTYRRGYVSPPLRLLPLPKLSMCIPRLWLPVLWHHTPCLAYPQSQAPAYGSLHP